jgi:hypothetical protein
MAAPKVGAYGAVPQTLRLLGLDLAVPDHSTLRACKSFGFAG